MVSIALSGGGARGISHLGVLKALDENGITPNTISGTSAGAIISGFYSAGFTPDQILAIIIKTKMLSIFKPAFSWQGLLSMDSLHKILKDNLPNTFESLKSPMIVAATAIEKGETHYFKEGDLHTAILASCCLPVLFSPVVIKEVKYIDGGILNNLPVEPLVDTSTSIIAVGCNPISNTHAISTFKDVMERSSLLAISKNTEKSKGLATVFIEPPLLANFSGFDLSKAQEIFETGYKYTSQNIAIFGEKLK